MLSKVFTFVDPFVEIKSPLSEELEAAGLELISKHYIWKLVAYLA